MVSSDSRRLLGTYSTPACCIGDSVACQVRGDVEVIGLTDAPMPWPVGKRDRTKAIILYGDLVEALKLEAIGAISFCWGVSRQTVARWRRTLGIKSQTEGTQRILGAMARQRGIARRGSRLSNETRRRMSVSQKRRHKEARAKRAMEKAPSESPQTRAQ